MVNGASRSTALAILLEQYSIDSEKYRDNPGLKSFNRLRIAAKVAHEAGDVNAYYDIACFFDYIDDPIKAYLYFMHVPNTSPNYSNAQGWIDSIAEQGTELADKVFRDRQLMLQLPPKALDPTVVFTTTAQTAPSASRVTVFYESVVSLVTKFKISR